MSVSGSDAGILDRWTGRARKALGAAADFADRLGQDSVQPAHVLLGILKVRRCRGAKLLRELDVDPAALEQALHERLAGGSPHEGGGSLPFSTGALDALMLGAAEAGRAQREQLGTEHLLLGLALGAPESHEMVTDTARTRLLCGWEDGSLTLWDTTRAVAHGRFDGGGGGLPCLCTNPAWSHALVGTPDGELIVLDLLRGARIHTLKGHSGPVRAVAWSPAQAIGLSAGEDGTVGIWNLRPGRSLQVFRGHEGPVHAVAFLHDGDTAVSGGADRLLRLWNPVTTAAIAALEGHEQAVRAIDVEEGDTHVRSTGEGGESLLWDAVERKLLERGKAPDEQVAELLGSQRASPAALRGALRGA